MLNKIKPTIALIKQQGPGKNGINLFNSLLYPLGPSLTVTTVLEKTNLFKFSDVFYLVLLIIIIIVSFIIFIRKNVKLLTKTFQLQDDYQITVRVEDYLNNAKYYKESTCITGINDQFDLNNTRIESLQSQFVNMFYNEEEREELRENFDEKIENHEKYNIEFVGHSPKNKKKSFKHGSIINESFDFNGKRDVLFLANSQVLGEQKFGGMKETPRLLKKIWSHIQKNRIHSKPLLMPLLGTGFSRDSTPMSSAISIIEQFFRISYPRKTEDIQYKLVVPHLIISITPDNIVSKNIDLIALHKYIEMMNERLKYAFTKNILYKKHIDEYDKNSDT